MKIRTSRLVIVVATTLALLSLSFPFSAYIRLLACLFATAFGISKLLLIKCKTVKWYVMSLCLFAMWSATSIIWTVSRTGYSEQIFNMFNAIGLNIAVSSYIIYRREAFDEIRKWLFPIFFVYLIQAIIIGNFDVQRRFSPGGANNQFGIATSYIFIFALYNICYRKRDNQILPILVGIMSACLTILTGSRKALFNLVLFIGIIIIFPRYERKMLKNLMKIFLVIVIVMIAFFVIMKVDFLYDVVGKRIVTLFSYYNGDVTEDMSALRREYMKQDAIELFKEQPLNGIGLNSYKYVARYNTYAHSNYYEILACLGIIGLTLYYVPLTMIAIILFFQWKNGEKDIIVPLCIMISFFINEFSNVSYMYRNIHLFVGVAVGLSMNAVVRRSANF